MDSESWLLSNGEMDLAFIESSDDSIDDSLGPSFSDCRETDNSILEPLRIRCETLMNPTVTWKVWHSK